jgi:hypothetical protein
MGKKDTERRVYTKEFKAKAVRCLDALGDPRYNNRPSHTAHGVL